MRVFEWPWVFPQSACQPVTANGGPKIAANTQHPVVHSVSERELGTFDRDSKCTTWVDGRILLFNSETNQIMRSHTVEIHPIIHLHFICMHL